MFEAGKIFDEAMLMDSGEQIILRFASKARMLSARMQLVRMKARYMEGTPGSAATQLTITTKTGEDVYLLYITKEVDKEYSPIKVRADGSYEVIETKDTSPGVTADLIPDELPFETRRSIRMMLGDGIPDEAILEYYNADQHAQIKDYIRSLGIKGGVI